MKKINILFVILSGFVLMISCLGEGSHMVEYGGMPGVVSVETEEIFIYAKDGKKLLPSNRSTSLGDGECVIVNYKIDLDDYKGEGFYSVELTSTPFIVESHDLIEPDRIMEKDTILNEKIISTFYSNTSIIRNRLFLYPSFTISDSLTVHNFYKMGYLKDQVPTQDTTLNNVNVYELILRAQLDSTKTASKTSERSKVDINAFDLTEFIQTMGPKEAPNDSMYVRIRYAKSFNSDSTEINWGQTSSIRIPTK